MFFTEDDYRKILKWLSRNAIKDSELNEADLPFSGQELVSIVQNGNNVRTSVKDLIALFNLLHTVSLVNVTSEYDASNISIEQALQLIPYKARKLGQIITFLNTDNKWVLYQFQGYSINQWNLPSLWVDLIKKIQGVPIAADEEDLTEENVFGGNTIIKFKDKAYANDGISGLGRVYLRKNIVDIVDRQGQQKTINLLTQSMLGKENTIYIIQYDYDLNDSTITVPEGCVLLFEGGKITKGTINLTSTRILPQGAVINDYITATVSGEYAIGQCLYDTTLNKPKWWTSSKWVDATGTEV